MWYVKSKDELYHHGIKGQKWGVRRFQNEDGSYTAAGRKRYGYDEQSSSSDGKSRKGLSDKQKKALKIGAAVVGVTAATAISVIAAKNYSHEKKMVNNIIHGLSGSIDYRELRGVSRIKATSRVKGNLPHESLFKGETKSMNDDINTMISRAKERSSMLRHLSNRQVLELVQRNNEYARGRKTFGVTDVAKVVTNGKNSVLEVLRRQDTSAQYLSVADVAKKVNNPYYGK